MTPSHVFSDFHIFNLSLQLHSSLQVIKRYCSLLVSFLSFDNSFGHFDRNKSAQEMFIFKSPNIQNSRTFPWKERDYLMRVKHQFYISSYNNKCFFYLCIVFNNYNILVYRVSMQYLLTRVRMEDRHLYYHETLRAVKISVMICNLYRFYIS